MDRLGFIHEKLDIKILILFVVRRLPDSVDGETLAELCLFDDGISYFEYAECLSELVDSLHLEQSDRGYRITEKGDRNGLTIESSLPYSVRKKAEKQVAKVAAKLRRNAMIKTEHSVNADGAVVAQLGLSDGFGEIISLSILTSGEEQAKLIEDNFRERAELIYNEIIKLLSEKD